MPTHCHKKPKNPPFIGPKMETLETLSRSFRHKGCVRFRHGGDVCLCQCRMWALMNGKLAPLLLPGSACLMNRILFKNLHVGEHQKLHMLRRYAVMLGPFILLKLLFRMCFGKALHLLI